MKTTGTVIVSALVGAAIGYGVARLTTPTVVCSSHILTVNPTTTQPNLGDQHVCTGLGQQIRWESSNGRGITVTFTRIDPAGSPYPYNLNCGNYLTSYCASGQLVANAVKGSTAYYELKIQGSPGTWNGRIIIDK